METIIKILLTIIYPAWFFLAKTVVGFLLTLMFCVGVTGITIYIFLGEGWLGKDASQGLAVLSFMVSPFIGMGLMIISDCLEARYDEYGYKWELPSIG